MMTDVPLMQVSVPSISSKLAMITGVPLMQVSVRTLCKMSSLIVIPPPQNVGGGYTGFALSRRSVGRSVRPSVRLQFLSAL